MPQQPDTSKRQRPAAMRTTRSPKAAAVPDTVLRFVLSSPWAISDEGLHRVLAIASRGYLHPEALEQVRGEYVDGTRNMTVRDGVATIPITGVLMRRASWFDAMCGAMDYQSIAQDVRTALDDPRIARIVLLFDTPGGEVSGCSELAQLLRAGREEKPIDAYIGGDCCSAGYWLAAQCSRILLSDTSLAGNIGVRLTYVDDAKRMKREGLERITIVSSQSPAKDHAPTTDAGRARVEAMCDQLCAVFLESVAEGRGVSLEAVIANYGDGRVCIGADAVRAGLADGVTTYEALLASYAAAESGIHHTEDSSMSATKAKPKAKVAPPARPRGKAATPNASADTNEDDKPADDEKPEAAADGLSTCSACDASLPDGAQYCPACGAAVDGDEGADANASSEPTDDEKEKAKDAPAAAAITGAVTAERSRIVGILAYADRYPLTALMPLINDANCSKDQAAAKLLEMKPEASGTMRSRLRALKSDEDGIAASQTKANTPGAPTGNVGRILANLSRVNPNAVPEAARAAAGSR